MIRLDHRSIKLAALIFHSMLVSSCVIYPHAVDVPLIEEKNDLRIDAGVSSAATTGVTFSYGLTEKLAIQGHGSYGVDNKRYLQGALGHYKKLPNNKIWEWYTGFGAGYGDAYKDANPGNLYGNYYQGFTQFNFGKVNARFANMDYGVSLKTGYLYSRLTDHNYYDVYYTGEDRNNHHLPEVNDQSLLFQPAFFAQFGGKKLKFNIKLSSMWIYKFTNEDKKLPVANFNLGLGLSYSINTKR